MSKIVGAYPPTLVGDSWDPPDGATWWRFRLQPNEDGHVYVQEVDAEQTWMSWEFFDGESTVIDCGLDRPAALVRLGGFDHGNHGHLDILHAGPPTPSPQWRPLTGPGELRHPEDRNCGCLCGKCLCGGHCHEIGRCYTRA
ncbi:hypothetical protein [Mycolicibacterium sphagni]|uniref:hypothetical protein n=1 Tax=Mycolicibacterium sphagni TaxID=1786 RepID=UPI0021F35E24|nr:hypothetical protein [Mycolicibacterium sphagni]MCV7174758.1 hypothetical protein [Mycolicibacterium sphagni]